MKLDKQMLLKWTLYIASGFYFVGAVVHYFGVTIFPWYEAALYSPYHDSIIAMAGMSLGILLLLMGRKAEKYKELVLGLAAAALVAGVLTLRMVMVVDFSAYGSVLKRGQAMFEGMALLLLAFWLWWLERK